MNKNLLRLMLLLGAISAVAFFILYPSLPAEIPMNIGLDGEVTSYGPKSNIIWLQLMPFACAGLFMLLPRIDPRKQNYQKHIKSYSIISTAVTLMLIAMNWAMVLPVLGLDIPVSMPIMAIIGVSFIIMGNYMPQIRSNYFMGIRTPWALSNEVVWRKTHRAGGILFCVSGALMVVCAFAPAQWIFVATMVILLGGCAGLYIYSYIVFKNLPDKEEDTHAED